MNIVIIEDELPAFKRLSKLIMETFPAANIVAHLDSVRSAGDWFGMNAAPDLVFLDIHLADGSGLDLLKEVRIECPVIFTTAYDNYAIEAFKTNSLSYLLKPIKKEDLEQVVQKLKDMRKLFGVAPGQPAEASTEYKKRFIIRFGEHIKTLATEDIAYCYSENKATYARTFDNRSFPMDHNLDALEKMLDPQHFFRINRQYLINLASIQDMKTYSKARVIITLQPQAKEQPVVSSERAADFKHWLGGE
ncbi:MAG: DNA-binding response regulator [Bacteroidetes bacterium 46-16]|nr:MAG: DNA-binding response regulator [Bacteroidetes bacterium 46-16]